MTSVQPIKVLYDTDIGSDIDDAVALAYLLAEPRCELKGITTVSGQAYERAMLASALCQVAGKPAMPMYPGVEHPLLLQQQHQPAAPQMEALERWPHRTAFPQGEAIEFLRRTIRTHPGFMTRWQPCASLTNRCVNGRQERSRCLFRRMISSARRVGVQ